MDNYSIKAEIKVAIDQLQIDFRCCGANSFKDWWDTEWILQRYVDVYSPEVSESSATLTVL